MQRRRTDRRKLAFSDSTERSKAVSLEPAQAPAHAEFVSLVPFWLCGARVGASPYRGISFTTQLILGRSCAVLNPKFPPERTGPTRHPFELPIQKTRSNALAENQVNSMVAPSQFEIILEISAEARSSVRMPALSCRSITQHDGFTGTPTAC